MRGATLFCHIDLFLLLFLLTHLMRGATKKGLEKDGIAGNFYSRTSCEVRPLNRFSAQLMHDFYSRTSCEVRLENRIMNVGQIDFYSRTSCEVRLRHDH